MCLAVPGKIIKKKEFDLADVEIGGVVRPASLELVPEAKEGQYVLIHAGYAIQTVDEEEAKETYRLLEEFSEASQRIPEPGSG